MLTYVQSDNHQKTMDDILSGRIAQINGVWYYTEYHVAYAQQGVSTAKNFVTSEEAEQEWNRRLTELRSVWGHKGARFTEELEETADGKRIRFRSLLKSGKPGKMTGVLYMTRIRRG